MQVAAKLKYARISPQKCRLIADLVRGKPVGLALNTLRFTPKKGARLVRKVLESAIANAEHNRGLPGDELVVARAWVDEGPTLKRFRPRAQGRATRIRKRTCHVSIVVGRPDEVAVLPERPATKQTVRRVRKDTAGKPATRKSASPASEATEATPEKTSKKSTAKKKTTAKKTTAKKTTAKKSTAKKSTAKKTTKKKTEEGK